MSNQYDHRQSSYSDAPRIGTPGRVVSDLFGTDIETGITPGGSGPKWEIAYVDGWASGDTITTTVDGYAIVATLLAGDTTIDAARSRHLQAINANSVFNSRFLASVSGAGATAKIVISGRHLGVARTLVCTEVTAGAGEANETLTVAASSVSDGLPPGIAVVRPAVVTEGREIAIPDQTGRTFVGILQKNEADGPADLPGRAGILPGHAANVVTRGTVLVRVEEDVTITDNVFFRHTAAGLLLPGGWRTDADTATADQVVGAAWKTNTKAGDIAELKLS